MPTVKTSVGRDLLWIAMLVALLVLAWRWPGERRAQDNWPVQVSLTAEISTATPGQTLNLGLVFDIAPGWHLYWHGRSDSGAPISVDLELPAGFTADMWQWPAPRRHVAPGDLLDHVYEEQVVLILPVSVPATARPGGSVTFQGQVEWVVCRDECQFGGGEVTLNLAVQPQLQAGSPSGSEPLFTRARRRIPRPWPQDSSVRLQWHDNSLVLQSDQEGTLTFYPLQDCGLLVDLLGDGETTTGRLALRFRAREGEIGPAHGVLEWRPAGVDTAEFYLLNERFPAMTGGNHEEDHSS